MDLFDGPFPANVPESERFVQPAPNQLAADRAQSGGLSDDPSASGNPVRNGPSPVRFGPGERDAGAQIKNLRGS